MKRLFFMLVLLWLTEATSAQTETPASPALEAARSYRSAHGAEILADFATLLAIPNVGSDSAGIHRNADFIKAAFEKRGARIELLKLPGAPPLIYGGAPGSGCSLRAATTVPVRRPGSWACTAWAPNSSRSTGKSVAFTGMRTNFCSSDAERGRHGALFYTPRPWVSALAL